MTNTFTRQVHGDPDDYTVVTKVLLEDLDYFWTRFNIAKTATTRANAVTELSNRVSDLVSWHPDYNYETGEIEYGA